MIKLTQVGIVFAAIETTPGVAQTITYTGSASDAVTEDTYVLQAIDPQFTPDFNMIDRNYARPSLSGTPHLIGRRLARITFSTEIFGTGVAAATTDAESQAGATPVWAKLFEGCAMAGTNVSTPAGRTYTPLTNNQKTLTIEYFKSGTLHRIVGAMGTFTITAQAGGLATINWEFTGVYTPVSDMADPTGASFSTITPPLVESCSFVIGATAASVFKFETVTITQGNNVVPRADGNSAQGFNSMYVTGRDIRVSVNPEAVAEADHPFWADLVSATQKSVSFSVGSTAGNKVTFTLPNCQGASLAYGDRDGIATIEVEMRAISNTAAGNNELAIKFV